MIDLEQSAATIADELGADLTYLQPEDEVRFDPATLAVLVGLWLLRSVADGVAEGIKKQSEEATTSLLRGVGAAIRRRARRDVDTAMASQSADTDIDAAKAAAASAWGDARAAIASVPAADGGQLADACAQGASEALVEAGLPAASAERVRVAIRAQARRLIDEAS